MIDPSSSTSSGHHPDDANHPSEIPLAALGWDAELAAAFASHAPPGTAPARVIAQHRGRYVTTGADGERDAVLAGRLRHTSPPDALPTVGDWVAVQDGGGDGTAVIARVLPRRSAFVRKAAGDATAAQVMAANVDVALVLTSPDDLSARRLERYLTLAWESGAVPVVVLTKADVCDDQPAALAGLRAAAIGADVIALSSATGEGVDALGRWLRPGRTAVLLGSSGVGKSTLANRLLGGGWMKTGGVREDGKGRHTTTHRELLRLPDGALLIDTPGLRELQLWSADGGLAAAFADVEALAAGCAFGDCTHGTEPGCAVRAAVESGALDAARLESWRGLQRELAYLARRQDQAAASADRAHARTMQRSLRAHLRRKYGE